MQHLQAQHEIPVRIDVIFDLLLQRFDETGQPIKVLLDRGLENSVVGVDLQSTAFSRAISLTTFSRSTSPRSWRTCRLGAVHHSAGWSLQNCANSPASALSVLLRCIKLREWPLTRSGLTKLTGQPLMAAGQPAFALGVHQRDVKLELGDVDSERTRDQGAHRSRTSSSAGACACSGTKQPGTRCQPRYRSVCQTKNAQGCPSDPRAPSVDVPWPRVSWA